MSLNLSFLSPELKYVGTLFTVLLILLLNIFKFSVSNRLIEIIPYFNSIRKKRFFLN